VWSPAGAGSYESGGEMFTVGRLPKCANYDTEWPVSTPKQPVKLHKLQFQQMTRSKQETSLWAWYGQ